MIEVNLGNVILSMRLHGSMRNLEPPADEDEEKARHDLSTKFVAAMAEAERVAVAHLCDELGYDEKTIAKIKEAHASSQQEARETEEKGRAAKNTARTRARL